jgi:hypothetical protein
VHDRGQGFVRRRVAKVLFVCGQGCGSGIVEAQQIAAQVLVRPSFF